MSLDLALAPNFHDAQTAHHVPMVPRGNGTEYDWICGEVLYLQMQEGLEAPFRAGEGAYAPIPAVMWYEDEGVWMRTTNPYGEPIIAIPAREVVKALSAVPRLAPKNRAVLAFFRALHSEARVLLWWH